MEELRNEIHCAARGVSVFFREALATGNTSS
jgi:hypothetical protein